MYEAKRLIDPVSTILRKDVRKMIPSGTGRTFVLNYDDPEIKQGDKVSFFFDFFSNEAKDIRVIENG